MKVQQYENNSPRLAVKVHVNHLLKAVSISEFREMGTVLKLKTPYKVYQRNDSIWFKNADMYDMDATDMNFQKNTAYVFIGNTALTDFTKGMTEGTDEYSFHVLPEKSKSEWTRLDHIIIELTGHPESIRLFMDKIDWKSLDAAFKFKIK